MSFEIYATDNGPVFAYKGNFFVLTSEESMLELCYEDPTCFDLIRNHIQEHLKDACDLYSEGFTLNLNPPAGKLYAYIAALQQFWMFRNHKFPQFLEAIKAGENQE